MVFFSKTLFFEDVLEIFWSEKCAALLNCKISLALMFIDMLVFWYKNCLSTDGMKEIS